MTDPDENGKTRVFTAKVMAALHGRDNRRGLSWASITGGVGLVVALVGLGGVVMDVGAQKEKIQQLEKRDTETRTLIQQKADEAKKERDQTGGKVDRILETLGEIRGELRSARNDRGARQ